MPNPVLYHNPRCSKSRQAMTLLSTHNISFTVKEYLKEPLDMDELSHLYKALVAKNSTIKAHSMLRVKESEYKLAGLSENSSDEEVFAAVAEYPKLLERPIFMQNKLAAIGRPTANIEALIND